MSAPDAAAEIRRGVAGRFGAGLPNRGLVVLVPLALLCLWEAAGAANLLPTGLIPTPTMVVRAWYVWTFGPDTGGFNAYSGTWGDVVANSAQRVVQGYLLAVLLGVPTGIVIGWSTLAAKLVDPTLQSLRPIPITAWLPFSIAMFGIKDYGAIFLICLGAFYPILINATHGGRSLDQNLHRAALMMGASSRTILFRVVLPNALPAIFAGMRIGAGIAWSAVIVAELVAVKSGLGYVLWDAYYIGRMDVVVADMASIGLLGFLTDCLLIALERRLVRWRHVA
jgi:NitT/TauT family transport system permease protein